MIHKHMSIKEIVRKYPEALNVFEEFGLGCAGCQAALFESIEEGAKVHGIDIESLLKSLNSIIALR